MKILWVGGWAICSDWLGRELNNHLKGFAHDIILPVQNWFEQFKQRQQHADLIAGYSFGAFLLLGQTDFLIQLRKPVTLYAPFLDFKAEAGQGSKIPLTQLKYLKRWLKKNPLEAIKDFYRRAEIEIYDLSELPYPLDDLLWGLDRMIEDSIIDHQPVNHFTAVIGTEDKLIDSAVTSRKFKTIVCNCCNHSIRNLLIESNTCDF